MKTFFSFKSLYFSVFFVVLGLLLLTNCNKYNTNNYVKAPFTGFDTLSTNDWWNRIDNKIINLKVPREDVVAFGIYTTANNKLKITAQLFPLFPKEIREVRLAFFIDNQWKVIQSQKLN